jgi:hypothetical protein
MFVFSRLSKPTSQDRLLSKRSGSGTAYDFYLTSTPTLGYYTGTIYTVAAPAIYPQRSVAWTHVNGAVPIPYADAVQLGGVVGAAGNIGTSAQPILVGRYYTLPADRLQSPLAIAVMVNVALSPAEVARLHRELTAAPGIVARARKGFSIPYPVKTPAEYAAESITFDTALQKVGNVAVANVGTSGTFQTGAQVDREATSGPFDGAVRMSGYADFGTVQGNPVPGTGSFAYSTWVRIDSTPTSTAYPVSKYGGLPLWFLSLSVARQFTWRARNALGDVTFGVATTMPTNTWMNVWFVLNRTTNRIIGYLNGVEVLNADAALLGAGTMTNANAFTIGKNPLLGAGFGALTKGTFWNREVTLADARKEYLEGARKCLLDARIHSDGSCPVSLAAVGAGNEIANGWKVQSGTWKVVEDAPSGGRAGERWLKAQAAATVSIRCNPQAFGSWWGKIRFNGVEQEWLFVATNETSVSAATQNGYGIHVTAGGALTLRERVAGAVVAILTPGVVLVAGTEYEFWPTRRVDGLFDLNIKGGAYADWTSLGTVTDTTTTRGGYQVLYGAGANAESRGALAFLGEMTTAEAQPRGLIT